MKLSCHWLSEYVDHRLDASALSHTLTMCGLEVEEEDVLRAAADGIQVGHVLHVARHPNADRLTVCQVDLGQKDPLQIICGAPNVAAGQNVAVATIGATLLLPGRSKPLKIKRAKMRGEVSMGMICAEDELGLSDDHSGIMVLDADAKVGEPFGTYLERRGISVQDTVLDIVITPNRPDATCHIGVARDISARCDVPLHPPVVVIPEAGGEASRQIKVSIACPDKCRRYVAMVVRGVSMGDSPLWLRRRLEAIGLRPINNVVDITNFVMHECGQPLHAFDYDKVADRTIVVRESRAQETITTLDGKSRTLPPGTVLICDGQRSVAIGGIMGGENSEVSRATTSVLIESAYFDPTATRRAARALGLSTDASYRFERGVDAEGQAWAAARAAVLMEALTGGTVVEGMVDAHPNPVVMPSLTLRHARIPKILGIDIAHGEVERILKALGFAPSTVGPDAWQCAVPPHRPDVTCEIDLIEEVARIHGFDKISLPKVAKLPGMVPRQRPEEILRRAVYGLLGGRGFREVYTNSLLSRAEAEQFCDPVLAARGSVVETLNAVSQSMMTLRPSLVPGILQVMGHNQNHGQDTLRFYEFGHVFHKVSKAVSYVPGFSEYDALILAISGPIGPLEWAEKVRTGDFFDLKGDVETLLESLRVPGIRVEPFDSPTFLTEYHAVIYSESVEIGRMARLSDAVGRAYDIKSPIYFAEFNWTRLVLYARSHVARRYQPISRFPAVTRDISLLVDRTVTAGEMLSSIRAAGSRLLQEVTIFDLYAGDGVDRGKQSIAFSLRFGAQRTLRDREVDAAIHKIVHALHEQHGAQLRGPGA